MIEMLRRLVLPVVFLAAFVAPLAAEEIALLHGREKTIVLSENPSTGYSWKIDREGSENLSILAIVDHGHKPGAAMPGAPGEHRWSLRAKSSGHAVLLLAYQRPWEPAPIETRRFDIDVP